jgi:hypothetical protein
MIGAFVDEEFRTRWFRELDIPVERTSTDAIRRSASRISIAMAAR